MTRRRALTALVLGLAASLALWASDARPAVIVLAGLVALVCAAALAALDLFRAIGGFDWVRPPAAQRTGAAADRWALSLRHQLDAGRRFGATDLRDTLAALVAERQAVRGIGTDALTPALRRLLAEPTRPVANVRELRRIVDDIEAM